MKIQQELQKLVADDAIKYVDDYEAMLDRIISLDKPCVIKELLSDNPDATNDSCRIPRSIGARKLEVLCDLGILEKYVSPDKSCIFCKPNASEIESY